MHIHDMDEQVTLAVGTMRAMGAFEWFLSRVNQKVTLEVGAKDKGLRASRTYMPSQVRIYQGSVPLQ